jgi:hypothetical protein
MEFNDPIVRDNKTSLSLYNFLSCQGFSNTELNLSLYLWIDLVKKKRDEYFVLTDDIVRTLGYKRRTIMLRLIRSHFVENTDFVVINTRIMRVTRAGEYHKRDIQMRKRSFIKLLVKLDTKVSRDIYEYLCNVEESIHRYDIYNKECELHRTDAFIEELQNEHECIILMILCHVSFVLFCVMMYFL